MNSTKVGVYRRKNIYYPIFIHSHLVSRADASDAFIFQLIFYFPLAFLCCVQRFLIFCRYFSLFNIFHIHFFAAASLLCYFFCVLDFSKEMLLFLLVAVFLLVFLCYFISFYKEKIILLISWQASITISQCMRFDLCLL